MKTASDDRYFNEFTKPVRKIGKIGLLLAILFGFIPGVYVAIAYDAMPTMAQIIGGWVMIASTEFSWYFVEPISYFPVLGEAGTYMSFLSGNATTIRIPSASVSQEIVDVKPGSHEGEIISSIAIAGSIILSMAIYFLAVVVGNVLFKYFPPMLQEMFNYVIPAIYGGLIMMYLPSKPALAGVALVIAMLLRVTNIIPSFLNMLVTVFLTVAVGIYLGNKQMKKAAAESTKDGEN